MLERSCRPNLSYADAPCTGDMVEQTSRWLPEDDTLPTIQETPGSAEDGAGRPQLTIIPFEAHHALKVQLQMAHRGVTPFVTFEQAKALEGEFAFTAISKGDVVAVGGVSKIHENRGLAWCLIDPSASPHVEALHQVALSILEDVPFHRIDADTPCDFEPGHRLLRELGFHLEAERMKAYQIDGEDSALYAKVK